MQNKQAQQVKSSTVGGEMKTLAICNQKGGVGKTSTTLNLALALQAAGQRVLVIDADPQGNLTRSLMGDGGPSQSLSELIHYEVARLDYDPASFIAHSDSGLDVIASSKILAAANSLLGTVVDSGRVLRVALDRIERQGIYDLVLIDCAPALDLLVSNALNAAQGVIIPTEPAEYSVDGIVAMVQTISRIRSTTNPLLKIEKVVINKFDVRKKNHNAILREVVEAFGSQVYSEPIPLLKEVEVSSVAPGEMSRSKQSRAWPIYVQLAEVILHG